MRLWGPRGRNWRAALVDQLHLASGQRVLDVASGTGQLAVELARRVRPDGSVDGVDASAKMVNRAHATSRRLGLPVTFHTASAQRLPFPDAAFDAATCTLALHHIARNDWPQVVDEIHRILRPGGRVLIADIQTPAPRATSLVPRLFLGHAMAHRPLDKAEQLLQSARFVNVTRTNTTADWVGLVIGTKA